MIIDKISRIQSISSVSLQVGLEKVLGLLLEGVSYFCDESLHVGLFLGDETLDGDAEPIEEGEGIEVAEDEGAVGGQLESEHFHHGQQEADVDAFREDGGQFLHLHFVLGCYIMGTWSSSICFSGVFFRLFHVLVSSLWVPIMLGLCNSLFCLYSSTSLLFSFSFSS